jgi:Barstar (barnase inhibitor)
MATVTLNADAIIDWPSFHQQCAERFGFPGFYGRNMNAWIDCLTYLPEGDGMSSFKLGPGENLSIHVVGFEQFAKRVPEISSALIECTAAVNQRYVSAGEQPRLASCFNESKT